MKVFFPWTNWCNKKVICKFKRGLLSQSPKTINWSGQWESNPPPELGKSRPLQSERFFVFRMNAMKSCNTRLHGTFYFPVIVSFILIFTLRDAHLQSFAPNKVPIKVQSIQNESSVPHRKPSPIDAKPNSFHSGTNKSFSKPPAYDDSKLQAPKFHCADDLWFHDRRL